MSGRLRFVEFGQQLAEYTGEVRELVGEHLPHDGVVDHCVAVNQYIAEGHDPGKLRHLRGELRIDSGQLVESLADDLELSLDRRFQHVVGLIVGEGLALSELVEPLGRSQRVPQIRAWIRPHRDFPWSA